MRNYLGARGEIKYALRVFSLTRQEQTLIVCVMLSLAIGSIVQHYRHAFREQHPVTNVAATPTPSLRAKDLYGAP